MTPDVRNAASRNSNELQAGRARIVAGLRSGSIAPREVLVLKDPSAKYMLLIDLFELGYGMSKVDAAFLLGKLSIRDWKHCRIIDVDFQMIKKVDYAMRFYEANFRPQQTLACVEA